MKSKKLTIFEGPDGSGKTTTARSYAEITGARYVHFPSLPNVSSGLPRLYVEAMIPALLGYQDVVFDRCWLSEIPYGKAFRNESYRFGLETNRMLERLSMRCGAVVVKCLPSYENVLSTFESRKDFEMLDNTNQLKSVYDSYVSLVTSLPEYLFDFTKGPLDFVHLDTLRMGRHNVDTRSAGNINGVITMVYDDQFNIIGNDDPLYQCPFSSFGGGNHKVHVVNRKLIQANVPENELYWIHVDDITTILRKFDATFVLGEKSARRFGPASDRHFLDQLLMEE